MRKRIIAVMVSGFWISLSEFVRNELLFKSYWLEKYRDLGLIFPSATINNMIWGIWSFLMAILIVYLVGKLRLADTIIVTWLMAFVMMWLVIGNLNVLPLRLLIPAVPLSILEVTLAAWLSRRITQ